MEIIKENRIFNGTKWGTACGMDPTETAPLVYYLVEFNHPDKARREHARHKAEGQMARNLAQKEASAIGG